MFYKIKEALIRFMYGRYGSDSLNKFLLICYIIISALNLFIGSFILYILALGLAVYVFFRMFSRNIYSRQKENSRFLSYKSKITSFFTLNKNRFKERKTHIYKKCPYCKAILRFPRKKGNHSSVCPKCSKSFKVKVR